MLGQNAESYSGPDCWVKRVSQKVKQKVSVAAIANLQGQKNSKKLEKMPLFIVLLGTDEAQKAVDQVWNIYFTLILELLDTVCATLFHTPEQ